MKPTTPTLSDRELKLKPYVPSPTAEAFHASNAFFRGILGPVGSGKSVACVMEIFSRALEAPVHDGRRRTRWAIIRSTYTELLSTSMKTWTEWVPEVICPIQRSPPITAHMLLPLADGTLVDMEVMFISCDRPEDAEKLKSLELTGAWINEASGIEEATLQMLTSRVGRFPPAEEGGGGWSGLLADTNAMSDDHWWHRLAEVERPKGYRFWRQPPAVIKLPKKKESDPPEYVVNDGSHNVPAAENLKFLRHDYYPNQWPGKSEEWVRSFLMAEYLTIVDGKPVFPEFRDSVHTASSKIAPYRGLPLILGFDFGLTPACVFMQCTPNGQILVLDEIVTESMGIQRMIQEILKPKLANEYPRMTCVCTCDPAGAQRSQTDETTCMEVILREGFDVIPCDTNVFLARKEAVVHFLTRTVDGKPAFQLSPKCEVLRRGMCGRYCYRKMLVGGTTRYVEKPEKNIYSHIADALQYACRYLWSMGAGGAGSSQGGLSGGDSWNPSKKFDLGQANRVPKVRPSERFAGYVV